LSQGKKAVQSSGLPFHWQNLVKTTGYFDLHI